jgi:LysM repeat protein
MFSTLARVGLPVVAGLALLGLSSCGGDDNGASVSTVQIKPSSYELKDPATTTTLPAVPTADAKGRSPVEQTYVIASANDVPFNIAKKYDITLDQLRNYNGWDKSYSQWPGKGGTVRIPPGAKFVDPNATTTTEAAAATPSTDATGSTTPTSGTGGDRCQPTYTVKSGDAPLVITRKFGITIEQLNAANTATPNWPNLYTGRTIKLPPPADCTNAVPAATTTTVAPG